MDQPTLGHVLGHNFCQARVEHDAVPLGLLDPIARGLVFPAAGGREADGADRRAVRGLAEFGIAAEVTHDLDFVDGRHVNLLEVK